MSCNNLVYECAGRLCVRVNESLVKFSFIQLGFNVCIVVIVLLIIRTQQFTCCIAVNTPPVKRILKLAFLYASVPNMAQ